MTRDAYPKAPDGGGPSICRAHKDETGVIRYICEATTRLLGWQSDDMVGRRSLEFIHPDDHDTAMIGWVRLLSEPGGRSRMRVRHSNSAGRWVWLDITNHNRLHEPEHHAVITEMVPVLDGTPARESTWVSSQLLRRLTEALPLGVLQIDQERRIVFSNERLNLVVGRAVAGTLDEAFDGLVPADRCEFATAVGTALSGADVDADVSLVHPELGLRRCTLRLRALTDQSGTEVTGALVCVIDVTEEARRRDEIEHRATYDGLTHCFNRVSILAALRQGLAGCPGDGGVALIFVDLDRFKAVNDEYGHAAGDLLLQIVAGRLRTGARDSDSVGRIGGDEFLVVCPGVESAEAAVQIAGRIAAAIRQPADVGSTTLDLCCSIGVAWSGDPDSSVDTIIAQADAAMYESKRDRGGQPVLATATGPAAVPFAS
jgi:diguanylate cyclase (GGDEF)-like protein/PAS domain S-box-containing protein